jgi:hypothetical protein
MEEGVTGTQAQMVVTLNASAEVVTDGKYLKTNTA